MRLIACVGVLVTAQLTGCGSMIEAMARDPVRVEKISSNALHNEGKDRDVVATVSLSAEKRNVLVNLGGQRAGAYCAEPPPEVAKSFDLDRSLLFEGEGQLTPEQKAKLKADVKDTTKEAITVLGQRTVLLDIYRTGTYTLCQYYANGAISPTELVAQFRFITEKVVEALKAPVETRPRGGS